MGRPEPKPVIKYGEGVEAFTIALADGEKIKGAMCQVERGSINSKPRRCGRVYLGVDAEHMASYCCCNSRPCDTDGCDGWSTEQYYTKCDNCRGKAELARYLKRTARKLEAHEMIVEDDNFFSSESDWIEHLAENDIHPDDARPIIGELDSRPTFEMCEHTCDYFGPDFDSGADFSEIDTIVNYWIEKNLEQMWREGSDRLEFDARKIQMEIDSDLGNFAAE